MINNNEARELIRSTCGNNRSGWAMKRGIAHSAVIESIKGYTHPRPQVMAELGYRQVIMWQKV